MGPVKLYNNGSDFRAYSCWWYTWWDHRLAVIILCVSSIQAPYSRDGIFLWIIGATDGHTFPDGEEEVCDGSIGEGGEFWLIVILITDLYEQVPLRDKTVLVLRYHLHLCVINMSAIHTCHSLPLTEYSHEHLTNTWKNLSPKSVFHIENTKYKTLETIWEYYEKQSFDIRLGRI